MFYFADDRKMEKIVTRHLPHTDHWLSQWVAYRACHNNHPKRKRNKKDIQQIVWQMPDYTSLVAPISSKKSALFDHEQKDNHSRNFYK